MFISKVKAKASWVKPWKTISEGEESASSAPVFLFYFRVLSVFIYLLIYFPLEIHSIPEKDFDFLIEQQRWTTAVKKTIKNYVFLLTVLEMSPTPPLAPIHVTPVPKL